ERALLGEQADASGDIGGSKPVGRRQGDQGLDDVTHPRLVEIDAADESFADLRGERQMLEQIISDKALIDAAESIGKPLEYGFQSEDHFREFFPTSDRS